MEVKGKIVKFLDVQKGQGSNGEWQKQEFVIETLDSKYPKNICLNVWGADKVENLTKYNKVDDVVTCSIEIESREFNGKYYTNVGAWMVKKDGVQDVVPNEQNTAGTDDLPF